MAKLSGAVLHALMAMKLWDEIPGMLCYIGNDFPTEHREFFSENFDTQGLRELSIPQMRC